MSALVSIEIWVLLACVVGLIWLYLRKKWTFLARLNIPHEPPSLLRFGNATGIFYEPFTIDNRNKSNYGAVWGFYLLTAPHIVVHDPAMIRQIFIDEFECFPKRQSRTSGVFGVEDGLNRISGAQWKRIRSTLTPTFPPERLQKMTPIMRLRADDAIQSLRSVKTSSAESFVLDDKEFFSRLVLDYLCSAVFGKDVYFHDDTKKDPKAPKLTKAKSLISIPSQTLFFAIYLFPVLGNVVGKIMKSVLSEESEKFFFQNLCKYVIDEGRRTREDDDNSDDVMKLLLESEISKEEVSGGAQKGLTKAEILANSLVITLAAYENPGNQTAFLAYNLAQHQHIQDAVRAEIDDMVKSRGLVDHEGVSSLKMLDMCLQETLRLYTPIARTSRVCTKNVTIAGVTFPKGVFVEIPAYALAHDPDYWDKPYEFKPERMRHMGRVDPMYFQPFGGGPRKCIAIQYVETVIKMSICTILQKYIIKPSVDTPKLPLELKLEMAVRPRKELKLTLTPRKTD